MIYSSKNRSEHHGKETDFTYIYESNACERGEERERKSKTRHDKEKEKSV